MGEPNAAVCLRMKPALRAELEKWAKCEQRSLTNICELLLGWSVEHLAEAGSIVKLLETKGKANGSGT